MNPIPLTLGRPNLAGASCISQEWPSSDDFDLPAMRADGWRPTPLSEFVVKIASRCNLDCDYCYVYHHVDQSWRGQPKIMSLSTIELLAQRIRAHASKWGVPRVGISFHGGEPLLAGAQFFDEACAILHAELDGVCDLMLMSQTNATLVTEEIAAALARNSIRVGVSLDGDRDANDRHRRDRAGRSSYDKVVEGIECLRAAGPKVFSGVLATIDLRNDPLTVYRAVAALDPRHCDFLLPHANWSNPPDGDSATPFADWLLPIFEQWYSEPKQRLVIRTFQDIMNLHLGGQGGFELVGNAPISLVSIETDGSIELVDTLKSAYSGAAATSHTLVNSSLDDLLTHPGVVARQIGVAALDTQCLDCRFVQQCGGGMYTHRYRQGDGFRNPSVYCRDLFKLHSSIHDRLRADLAAIGARP